MWLVEAFLLREKMRLIFAWRTFTLFFSKGIVKDVVESKQSDFWHANSSNMIFGHVKNCG